MTRAWRTGRYLELAVATRADIGYFVRFVTVDDPIRFEVSRGAAHSIATELPTELITPHCCTLLFQYRVTLVSSSEACEGPEGSQRTPRGGESQVRLSDLVPCDESSSS